MKIAITAAIAAAALVSPAFAQEVPGLFTGARIEGRVGVDHPRIGVSATDGVDSIDETEGKTGLGYGAEVGFDFDLSGFVAGAYAGIDGSTVKECSELYGEDEVCLKAGRNITLGARAGARVGSALLYVKGGYSNGQLKLTYEDFENLIDDVDESGDVDGFHIGGGVEAMLNGNVYGKIEYVYTDYNGSSVELDGATASADLKRHQLLAGVGVRF